MVRAMCGRAILWSEEEPHQVSSMLRVSLKIVAECAIMAVHVPHGAHWKQTALACTSIAGIVIVQQALLALCKRK